MKIDGFKEALELLQGMNSEEQKRIISDISKDNPELANALENNMVSINDLIYITPKMLVEFLRGLDRDDLGRSLRLANPKTKEHLMSILPSSIGNDIKDIVEGAPLPVEKVQESMNIVLTHMKTLMSEGKIILSPNDQVID
jgi:flagellar motor switch protein FliG